MVANTDPKFFSPDPDKFLVFWHTDFQSAQGGKSVYTVFDV